MNKAYHLCLAATNKLLAGLLTLMGFSMTSCNTDVEYGSPYATYEIKGKVVDEAGTAIPDIQVVIAESVDEEYALYAYRDTLKSNDKGTFDANIGLTSFGENTTFEIKTEDIDGELNGGQFEEKTTEIAFKREDLKGADGHWFYGKATKEVTIVLKNKE